MLTGQCPRKIRASTTVADAVAKFVVNKVATYPNSRFPARQVYGSHGHSALQLVTCGGQYDKRTGYQANVVVYTALAASTPAN